MSELINKELEMRKYRFHIEVESPNTSMMVHAIYEAELKTWSANIYEIVSEGRPHEVTTYFFSFEDLIAAIPRIMRQNFDY